MSGAITIYPYSHTTYTGTMPYSYWNGNCSYASYGGGSCYSTGYTYCADTAYAYPPASCSVWFDTNPISYGATTVLHWSSSNADSWVYISNIGYVGSSGAMSVGPLSTTNYSCEAYGSGGTDGWHNGILTVNAPANCTFNGQTVAHGSSVTAYQSSTVPYGSSCVSQARTCSNGTLSGTYAYSSCAVGPQCTLSLNPSSITVGQSSTLSWSSQNATSCE